MTPSDGMFQAVLEGAPASVQHVRMTQDIAVRQIRFNAFDMNCVAHQSSGLWRHPDDRSRHYNTLEYWTDLARLLESGTFDGIFIADVLGTYDVYGGTNEAAICNGDYVVVKQAQTAENGEIVAAMIDGEATVKTFQRKDDQVWLMPHNAAYDPIDGTNATILGKVTAVLRRM